MTRTLPLGPLQVALAMLALLVVSEVRPTLDRAIPSGHGDLGPQKLGVLMGLVTGGPLIIQIDLHISCIGNLHVLGMKK